MNIEVGDKFKVVNPTFNSLNPNGGEVVYTVTRVNGNRISWDCTGRKYWYKNVNKGFIEEHVNDLKDLIKI
jgi:hypothetical protein